MNPPQPRVTVVVPSFNQGRYLSTCLRSLVAQRSDDLETLVFDNVSTDGTAEVLQAFAPLVTRVTIERDAGQSAALNRGFREARGEVIGWLNADDMLLPGTVERAVRALDEKGADVVYGHCAHLDSSGASIGYFPYTRPFDSEELRNYNDFIPQPATFFRRSLLDRVGFLDVHLHYAMDWDLWCRFARAGARFAFVPEIWAGARIHPDAKTSRGGWRRLAEVWRVNSRHRTLPVPMLPILYAAYRANRALPLARVPLLKDWWRRRTGGARTVTVRGVGHNSMIVGDPVSLSYPVYDRLERVEIDIDDAGFTPASMTLNGRPMTRIDRAYVALFADQEVVDAVEIRIAGIARPLPTPFTVSHHLAPRSRAAPP